MDTSPLERIIASFQQKEKEINQYIDALKDTANRWNSILTAFKDNSSEFDDFKQDFPDLQSKLELEQASQCDSIISELSRYLLTYEHSLTQSKAIFNNFKEKFKSKPLETPYTFPPAPEFITTLILETAEAISTVEKQINCRGLAIYELGNVEESINPVSILRFIEKWNQFTL